MASELGAAIKRLLKMSIHVRACGWTKKWNEGGRGAWSWEWGDDLQGRLFVLFLSSEDPEDLVGLFDPLLVDESFLEVEELEESLLLVAWPSCALPR